MENGILPPLSLNCDFEKAIHGAARKVFKGCIILGCFFHLCQNWWRRAGSLNIITKLLTDTPFRKVFKMLQALAYLPACDVIQGFEAVKESQEFNSVEKTFINYIEKNYVGGLSRKGERKVARFPIETWNLHTRVLEGSPTTNNPVESWHSSVTADTKSHATLNVVLEEIQLEQAKTESHLIRLDAGEVFKKDIKRSRRDKMLRIKNMVESYSTYPSIISLLTAMSHGKL